MADALKLRFAPPFTMASEHQTLAGIFATALVLNATTVKAGWVAQIPYADTITAIGYHQGVTTGTPAAGSYTVTLQTLDANGLPNGDIGGGSPTATTFQPSSANDGKWVWVTLGNSHTFTRGTQFALTIEQTSTDGTNYISVVQNISGYGSFQAGPPHSVKYSAGAWAKLGSAYEPVFGYKGTNIYGLPLAGAVTHTVNTTGNRLAMKFTLPSTWFNTFRVLGFRVHGTEPLATNYKVGIWNAAGTALSSSGNLLSNAGIGGTMTLYFSDTTLPTLSAGTAYYAGIECVGGAQIAFSTLDFTNAADLAAVSLGTNAYYSTWNGSAWTDTTTSRPWLELILDDITAPAGGGGLLRNPGQGGGVNG